MACFIIIIIIITAVEKTGMGLLQTLSRFNKNVLDSFQTDLTTYLKESDVFFFYLTQRCQVFMRNPKIFPLAGAEWWKNVETFLPDKGQMVAEEKQQPSGVGVYVTCLAATS